MDFDIQLDERGRLKIPASLHEALTASPEMSLHLTVLGDTLILRRSPKAPPSAPDNRTTRTPARKGRKAPSAKAE